MEVLVDKNLEFEVNFVNGIIDGDGCCKYPDGM